MDLTFVFTPEVSTRNFFLRSHGLTVQRLPLIGRYSRPIIDQSDELQGPSSCISTPLKCSIQGRGGEHEGLYEQNYTRISVNYVTILKRFSEILVTHLDSLVFFSRCVLKSVFFFCFLNRKVRHFLFKGNTR